MLVGNSRAARNEGGRRMPLAGRPSGVCAAEVPGGSLIEGGFGNRPRASRARGRKTVRAAAPLLVPLALALTLGVILAVSSGGSQTTHVDQTTSRTVGP